MSCISTLQCWDLELDHWMGKILIVCSTTYSKVLRVVDTMKCGFIFAINYFLGFFNRIKLVMICICTWSHIKLLQGQVSKYSIIHSSFKFDKLTHRSLFRILIIDHEGYRITIFCGESVIRVIELVLNRGRGECGVLIVEPDTDLLHQV